jgi:hypothetical protein
MSITYFLFRFDFDFQASEEVQILLKAPAPNRQVAVLGKSELGKMLNVLRDDDCL